MSGFATLYKEKSIIAWSQPVDIHCLSSWLFFYQFVVACALSPVIYAMQGKVHSSYDIVALTILLKLNDMGVGGMKGSG